VQTNLTFTEETWNASLKLLVSARIYFLSVKRNAITAFAGSNWLGIFPRKQIWNKWMHVVKWNVNERHEVLETILSTSHRIQHKFLIEDVQVNIIGSASDQRQHFIGNRNTLLLSNATAPFRGQIKPCLSNETRWRDDSVRYASHGLLPLKVTAKFVCKFKSEGELCKIATAQLTPNPLDDNQDSSRVL